MIISSQALIYQTCNSVVDMMTIWVKFVNEIVASTKRMTISITIVTDQTLSTQSNLSKTLVMTYPTHLQYRNKNTKSTSILGLSILNIL